MFLTPEVAKRHLRVDMSLTVEDELIGLMTSAAEDSAVRYLNRYVFVDQAALDEAITAGTAGTHPIVINDAIKAAMLLILGHLYANREDVVVGVSANALPMGSRSLLDLYRMLPGV